MHIGQGLHVINRFKPTTFSPLSPFCSDQLDKQSALKLVQRLENDALNPKLAADVVGPEPEAMFESAPADLRGWNNVAEAAAGAGAGNDLMDAGEFGGGGGGEPSLEYEFTRRRIQTNIAEIWNFLAANWARCARRCPAAMPIPPIWRSPSIRCCCRVPSTSDRC